MWGIIKKLSSFLLLSLILIPGSAFALSLDPSVLDVAVIPGTTTSTTFTFANTSDEEKRYSIDLVRATLGPGEGEAKFFSIEEPSMMPPTAPEDPANWFSHDQETVTLAAGASQDITIHIHPPASVPAQVFVLGIRLLEQSKPNSNVILHGGAIELAFVTIGEGLSPDLQILSFDFPSRTLLAFPSRAAITLRNDGNGIGIPDGSVIVKNMFGSVVGDFPINADGKRVPPGQTRTWFITTPVSAWANVYSVTLVGGEENGFTRIGEVYRVLVISPWVIGGILAGAILFVVSLRRRKRQQK